MKPSIALEIARAARPLIAALLPGQSVAIAMPDAVLSRPEASRRVGTVAWQVLGPGNYTVDRRSDPAVARVTYHGIGRPGPNEAQEGD